jgi:iron complex outermembrane recepter protein
MFRYAALVLPALPLKTKKRTTLLVSLGMIGTAVIWASGPGTEEPVVSPAVLKRMSVEELLAQPVLSSSRQPEPWSQAASDIFLIRGQSVAATGATTLPDLLRLSTSLFVAQSSSSQWAVNARGFVRSNAFSNKLLVMIDGRTVYSPLFSNVFWDSTSVFLPDLARIEVISGPAGATWGANAVNGVINIETKSARETLGGLVFTSSGTQEKNFGVRYGAKMGATGAVRFYIQGADHDGSLSGAGVADNFDQWKSLQGGMRADWGNDLTGKLTVQGDIFSGHYDNGTGPRTTSDNSNLLARWSRDLSPGSHFWVRLYHDYSKRDNQGALTEITRTTDLEFQHSLSFNENQELLWGGNYRRLSDSMRALGFVILPSDLAFGLGSVFAQHKLKFADNKLQLTTGLRLEHNHFSGWEYQPNVRLAWRLPNQTVWLSASRATRIPSRLETGFFQPAQPPYIVVGGENVVAEIVTAYELGWRANPAKNVSVTTTLYLQNYDHLRSVEPTSPVTFANGVKGRSNGLEMFLDWEVNAWWRMRVGGFRMNQETSLRPGGADLERGMGESSFPEYQIQLRNTFHLGKSLSWWTNLRRVANVPANDNGGGVVPEYTEFDMSLQWVLNPNLEISLTGRNLLDASHPEIGGLAVRREIERAGEAAVRFKF